MSVPPGSNVWHQILHIPCSCREDGSLQVQLNNGGWVYRYAMSVHLDFH